MEHVLCVMNHHNKEDNRNNNKNNLPKQSINFEGWRGDSGRGDAVLGCRACLDMSQKFAPPKNAARKFALTCCQNDGWTFIGGRTPTDVWQASDDTRILYPEEAGKHLNHSNDKPRLRAPNHSHRLTCSRLTLATEKHRRANAIRLFACLLDVLRGALYCVQVTSLCVCTAAVAESANVCGSCCPNRPEGNGG